MSSARWRVWFVALPMLVTVWAFWPGLFGGFFFDDLPNLVHAKGWKAASLAFGELWRALHSDISGSIGRPLSMLSFAINHALTGLNPWWLKLTNLLWHLLNGLLLGLLLRAIFSALPDKHRPSSWAVWVLVALWLLHPLQVSTVLYVVQRMEIAATSGILLSLLCYVRFRCHQQHGATAWPWLLAACAAWLVGLGFKETALLAPAFAGLIELCIFRFTRVTPQATRRLRIAWLLVGVMGFAAYLAMIWPTLQHWPYASRGWSPWERLLTQGPVLVMYMQQILLPLPESYHYYYDNFPVSHGLFAPAWTATSFLILGLLAALAIWLRRRCPLVALGIGWFFVAHALTSNLWPLELAFEHRNYLAIAGVLLALLPLAQTVGRKLHADARAVLILLPIGLFAMLTHVQAKVWGNPTQLAWTLENRNPSSPRASYGLGERLLAISRNDADAPSWAMALGQFEHAAQLPGDPALPLQAQLVMLGQAERSIPLALWQRFGETLAGGGMRPEHAAALYAVSQCRIERRCEFDDNALLATFFRVVEAYPDNKTALTLYANFAWNVLQDHALAIAVQRDAAALAPRDSGIQIALAKFLLASDSEAEQAEGKSLLTRLHGMNRSGLLTTELDQLQQLADRMKAPQTD